MIPFFAQINDSSGDASEIVWLIVGILAIIALVAFLLGKR
jgi:LPXTG-motif cell wall-anchored protein